MKYNFMKNRNSYGKIFGASVLALVMLMTAILTLTLSPTAIAPIVDEYDFGDAPDSYNTTYANNGARHIMNSSNYYMGTNVDNESDGQPNPTATGDDWAGIDDEDGVTFSAALKQGHLVYLRVTTHIPIGAGNGNLSGWIDYNRDGDWEDAGELLFSDLSLGSSVYAIQTTIPCTAEVGWTYLRLRFSSDGNLSFDGFASDGEVEDHRVYINEDAPYPSQSIEFGGPKIIREWQWSEYYVVGPYTPVWINSSDACPGSEKIEYSIWVADDLEDPIVWTFLWNLTVYDNDENDLDETYGSIVTEFYNDETCLHEVRYQCWDYDGATEGFFTIDFFVDKCGPITTKVVGCPKYSYGWPYPPWISGITPLTFNSVDNCCLPNGTAVDKITIKVWWKADTCDSSGAFNLIDTIVVEDGDGNDINPAEGRVGYEFHFEQTGYYELEYWGVDMMGNIESHHKQQHRVDVDPPVITKTYPEGGYYEIEEHEGFIKCCSPINLTVEEMPDDTCNAGLYGMFWRYEWNETYYPAAEEEGAVNGQDIVDLFCIEDYDIYEYWWYPYDEEIHFLEECVHDLYYFAIDNVGNYDEVHHQVYYVDNTPPIAIKEIGEPKCQNELEGDDWCVKEETPIWINVTDNGTEPCIVGSVHLYYRIWYDGAWEDYYSYVPEGTLSEEIHLENPCKHYLEFYVKDNVGNRWPVEGYHNETFYVDESPPIIIKTVGDPNCSIPCCDDYCVNLSTLITLDAIEVGCCQNGTVTLEYRIWFEGEWTDWMPYVDPFNFTEECKHYLEVRASDCLGNEALDNETFYVDETPPVIVKTVGQPNCPIPGTDDYCVNLSTKITLDATNGGCCPNEEFTFEYRIWWEEEGWTPWMEYEGPFSFWEECMHYLEVRAEDCLGNMAYDNETFYVDETPPEIIKTVGEPKCEVPDSDDWCVTTGTLITLEAMDEDCCPNSNITIEYMISHPGAQWQTYTEPFSFGEECAHTLYVRAYDCLGNGMEEENWDKETFYVDDSAPEITKTVGDPKCEVPGTDDWCVTTGTLITLEAMDEDCCPNSSITIEYKIGDGGWQTYVDPFSFAEECEHILTVRAYDCLGNGMDEEFWHNETFYVDDTDPVIVKTVGDPNCYIDDDEYCVTTDTVITINASDNGCCDDLTVWIRINGNNWFEISDSLPFDLTFDEECEHELEIWAFDCLGHEDWDNETFYVDDTAPVIVKTVGNPNCFFDLDNSYCVTTDTVITIDAYDDGCCDNLTVWYCINFGEIVDITEMLPYDLTFDEECEHTLEILAFDCLGHETLDVEVFYVDDTAPVIEKTVGDPNCFIDEGEYCVTTDTVITINASDDGCCDNLTVMYAIAGIVDWVDISDMLPFNLTFDEECYHELAIKAFDCLGHEDFDIEDFYVDDTAPVIVKTVGDPNCLLDEIDEDEYCVTTDTNITIDAYDDGCCDNLTVWYRINEGDWVDITEMLPYNLSFDEECEHELEIWAFDCLGHEDRDVEMFYVDDTAPVIVKTVGDPNCYIDEGEYCVTTSTVITIDINDEGCCDEDITVLYRINAGDMIDISDLLPYELTFDEECNHTLQIWAFDCLGHEDYDLEIFHVDNTAPVIEKTVGDPNCFIDEGEYCVTTDTVITIDAYDPGCCDFFTVQYRINNGEIIIITDLLPYNLSFAEECNHTLEIWAYDCIGRGDYDSEIFHVDDTYPVIEKTVGDPNCVIEEGSEYCVNTSTIITIDAYDEGCCDDLTVLYSINGSDPMDITEQLPYNLSFEEECEHLLEIWAFDCLGHDGYDSEIFYVDETPPELNKDVGDPHVYLGNDSYGHDIWLVYPETDICFEAIDLGCCEGGGTFIYYRYWYLGNWSDWMEYEGCINLEEGCVHYLEAYATDCLGNAGEIDNETFWVCGPGGGSDDPNVEIIFPEHGSTQNTDVVEVILHAYDDETYWDDLGVYLWIPGGRRDAPFLYYDVTQLPGEEDYYHAFVPIYWYQGGAQITLEAIAIDEDGNTGVALPVTFTVDSTIVWDQWMQYGWNPLPLSGGMPPNFGCNESIESVMYSVNGSYDWVFHYDLDDDGWISYYTEREINWLTTIEGGKSYWVHIFNESGLRYYIGVGEIEILYPEDEALLFDLNEINGTTWNSETGMEDVHIQIYYKDENNTKHYWTGSAWVMGSTYLPCDLELGYIQNWLFDSSGVAWIPGETFYAKARAMDKFGCYVYDMVSFVFEEGCLCAPSIDLEKYVWDGEEWVNETEVFVEDVALFNISIANDGELIGSGDEYYTGNETILQAIDDGLAWLASQQNADGSLESSYRVGKTAFAVLKWAEHAKRFLDMDPFDPAYNYSSNIVLGLNYMFNHSYNVSIGIQPAGDPDTNGNGNGIAIYGNYAGYETGIAMQAIEATCHPERIVEYGTHAGWTYYEVMEDCVDWIAWAQGDTGTGRGGWRYSANYGTSDNSVCQWAVLGLWSAESWGINAPSWVKTENLIWLDYSQNANGGFGYSGPSGTDVDVTAAGIIQLNYCGKTIADSDYLNATTWLTNNWGDLNQPYAMYAVMKASMTARPSKITHYGTHDWGQEYDDYLIAHQNADGSFPKDTHAGSFVLGTEYALLVLQRIAPEIVSDCPPCNLSEWYINDTLPEGLEYVENSTKIIVMSCDGYFESSGPEVQPEITYNPDGTTTLEWEEDGDEPFNLTLCTTMYIYFNATVLDCEAPDGHINTAYITAYSPDDDSWVSDEDTATVWGDCEEPE